jgi:predicted TIM-barrel fold metal-dependent hydrolase
MRSSPGLNRRDVLTFAVAAGVASAGLPSAGLPAIENVPDENHPNFRITDTNISLFRWPFRRLPLDHVDDLVRKLRSLGVTQAWAGSYEGILNRDIAGVNQRLADACRRCQELIPFGSVNPSLPDWEGDLRKCIDEHNMPGIRLHPNYHDYTLNDPRLAKLFELATEAGLLIQIAAAMEDTRTQHPMLHVPDVDLALLPELLTTHPRARVQILNHHPRSSLLQRLTATPSVCFDTARVEGTDGVPMLVNSLPPGRVLFGSHSPFLIPEASLIRVHESETLNDAGLQAVLSDNAKQVLGRNSL